METELPPQILMKYSEKVVQLTTTVQNCFLKIRKEVTQLYNFVRAADDYVDSVPKDTEGFMNSKKSTTAYFQESLLIMKL